MGGFHARYLFAVLAAVSFAIIYGLKVNLSVCIVAMVNQTYLQEMQEAEGGGVASGGECPEPEDHSPSSEDGPFEWSETQQGLLLGAYFWGYILSELPGGYVAEVYSARWVMFGAVLVNVVATALTPPAAYFHFYALVTLRVLEGLGGGCTFPAMHVMISHWAPPHDRAVMTAIIYAGTALGTVISFPLSGVIAGTLGWEWVFYIMAALSSIWAERNLRSIDPNHLGCKRYPDANNTCFTFRTCCTIKSLVKNFSRGTQSVTLNYAIEAETFNNRKKFSRVYFAPGSSKKSNIKKRQIILKPDLSHKGDLRHCEEETVFIKENTRDIQSPISFRLAYTLVQREPRQAEEGQPLPSIDSFPILNQQEASKVIHATFQKDCGDNDICESELVVDARPVLTQRESGAWDLTLGRDQEMKLDIRVNNYRESAYEAQLFISHPASLSYIGHKTENKKLICRPYNSTLVSCSLGNPFKRDMPAKLTVRFDPRGLDDIESMLEFRVFANSTSTEVNPQDPLKLHIAVIRKAELSIRGLVQPDHMFYSGPVVGESAIRYHDEVGSRVLHLYKVYNEGPWRVAQVDVVVDWPIQVANDKPQGKWLLYLIEPPSVEAIGGGQCYMEPEQVNPLGLVQRPGVDETPLEALIMLSENENNASASTRRKRDTEMVIRAELQTDKDGRQRQIVTMSCSQGSAKCIRFRCSVRNLQMKQEAVVKIRSRLWNSTLVEDYPKVDSVRILSRARIELPESPAIHQNTADDEAEAETEAFPDKLEQQEAESVPVWIIIVAIVAGLLLLILLTLVLWKLGFFKRRRPDPTLSGNLEKHRDENGDYAS